MPVAAYWPLLAPITVAVPVIPAPQFDEDDFLALLQRLLPPGRALPRDPDALLTQFLRGFAKSQARTSARMVNLLTESPTGVLVEMLPEWEETLGLPDPCAGPDASFAARQAHVQARIRNKGGQSIPYLIAYALSLGFVITTTEFTPTRIGARIGDLITGDAWAYALQINAAATTITYARIGAVIGDRLASWGNAVLECELRRVAGGHLTLTFAYH